MTSIRGSRNMFVDGFLERRDLEQYFWTQNTIDKLKAAVEYETNTCCLCVPTLAHEFHEQALEESDTLKERYLFDIDTRFNYLPLFKYFNILTPDQTDIAHISPFKIIVFDPPFFYIPMETLFQAVLYLTRGEASPKVKLLVGFLKREEADLMRVFRPFKLARTTFQLQYSHVKPNKWANYCLYSNVDLPGIKRLKSTK
ncbi:hypothetical protein HDV06_006154 [Boothiomyces sp. JEL0866]|nr:hypothetical protein HDV06_006154 [Boothiomyces sp. JEL0866]